MATSSPVIDPKYYKQVDDYMAKSAVTGTGRNTVFGASSPGLQAVMPQASQQALAEAVQANYARNADEGLKYDPNPELKPSEAWARPDAISVDKPGVNASGIQPSSFIRFDRPSPYEGGAIAGAPAKSGSYVYGHGANASTPGFIGTGPTAAARLDALKSQGAPTEVQQAGTASPLANTTAYYNRPSGVVKYATQNYNSVIEAGRGRGLSGAQLAGAEKPSLGATTDVRYGPMPAQDPLVAIKQGNVMGTGAPGEIRLNAAYGTQALPHEYGHEFLLRPENAQFGFGPQGRNTEVGAEIFGDMLRYADAHRGQFPASVEELYGTQSANDLYGIKKNRGFWGSFRSNNSVRADVFNRINTALAYAKRVSSAGLKPGIIG